VIVIVFYGSDKINKITPDDNNRHLQGECMAADASDVSGLLQSVREEVVMATYTVMLIAGTVLMAGNMSRNLHLGNPLSIPHIVLYTIFLCTYFLRHRIGSRWLAPILLGALFMAGTFGYLIYGFIGNSAPVYMALCIILRTARRPDCRPGVRRHDGSDRAPGPLGTTGVFLRREGIHQQSLQLDCGTGDIRGDVRAGADPNRVDASQT
jgi:hypothetical protein